MLNQSPFILQPWLFVLWCLAGIATRHVKCFGSTEHPDEAWMLKAVDRAITDEGIIVDKRLGGLLKSYRRAGSASPGSGRECFAGVRPCLRFSSGLGQSLS